LAGVGRAYACVIAGPRYFPLWLGQLISNFGDMLHTSPGWYWSSN
jgi:hypothetical protein